MFEDPKLFRQARGIYAISKREVADAAGEKESSVADVEAERKKFRPELAYKLWAALWKVKEAKGLHSTQEQAEKHSHLFHLMFCADAGMAIDVSPEKLRRWYSGEAELTDEEEGRLVDYMCREPKTTVTKEVDYPAPTPPRLTFEQARHMPLDDVIDAVTTEVSSGTLHLLMAISGNRAPEEMSAILAKQVKADPRVQIAGAKAWIAHVEKERDDSRRELLAAKEELLGAYRRIAALEKEVAQKQ